MSLNETVIEYKKARDLATARGATQEQKENLQYWAQSLCPITCNPDTFEDVASLLRRWQCNGCEIRT